MGEERGTNIMSGRASLEPEKVLNNDKISIALWELQECLNNLQEARDDELDEEGNIANVVMEVHTILLTLLITYVDTSVDGDQAIVTQAFADMFENTARIKRSFQDFTESCPDRHKEDWGTIQ